VMNAKTLRFGLGAIKGAGAEALAGVMQTRAESGLFQDLFDFTLRTYKQLNRRVIESLIDAGAMDALGAHRAQLHANLNKALDFAQQEQERAESGQNDLFGEAFATEASVSDDTCQYDSCEPWTQDQLLKREKAVLGFYASGHPFDQVRDAALAFAYTLDTLPKPKAVEFGKRGGQQVVLAGRVDALRTKIGKRGDKMLFVAIEDKDQVLEASVFGELANQVGQSIAVDDLVVVEGELSLDGYSGQPRLRASRILPFAEARLSQANLLLLTFSDEEQWSVSALAALLLAQQDEEAGKPVRFFWQQQGWQVPLQHDSLRVRLSSRLITQLDELGVKAALVY